MTDSTAIIDNALVTPCTVFKDGTVGAAAFDVDGRLVPNSQLSRSAREISKIESTPRCTGPNYDEAIYVGPLLNHYGHFMLEALSRLWYAAKFPDIPILWSCRVLPDLPVEKLKMRARYLSFQIDILSELGIVNSPLFCTETCSVRRLHVPASGYRISDIFTKTHDNFLSVKEYLPQSGKKVWLSRSRLKNIYDIGELNSARIEARLHDDGWDIYHPQEHSFSDQLSVLASAERVAGLEGSALHNLIFLKNCQNLQVDIVIRRRTANPNYQNIADRKGFTQHLQMPEKRKTVVGKGAHVVTLSAQPASIVKQLSSNDGNKTEKVKKTVARNIPINQSEENVSVSVEGRLVDQISDKIATKNSLIIDFENEREQIDFDLSSKARKYTFLKEKFDISYSFSVSESVEYLEMPIKNYLYDFAEDIDKYDSVFMLIGDSEPDSINILFSFFMRNFSRKQIFLIASSDKGKELVSDLHREACVLGLGMGNKANVKHPDGLYISYYESLESIQYESLKDINSIPHSFTELNFVVKNRRLWSLWVDSLSPIVPTSTYSKITSAV